jgi:hypothetical protein
VTYSTYLIAASMESAYAIATRIVHSETDPRSRAGAGILTELRTCPPLFLPSNTLLGPIATKGNWPPEESRALEVSSPRRCIFVNAVLFRMHLT